MAVLSYRVYYSAPPQYEGAEWFNVFHFETTESAESERSRLLCYHLCNSARALHLPYVAVQRVVVAPYPTAPATVKDPAPFVYSADRHLQAEARAVGLPAPAYTALTLKKETGFGSTGSFWFFHCLLASELSDTTRGQYVLKNVAEFEQLVQFWFRDGLEAFQDFQLVVAPSAKNLVQQGAARPCRVHLGAVVKARVRAKYRAQVQGNRAALASQVGEMAELGNKTQEAVKVWADNGLDFTPPQLRLDVVQLMTGINALADKIKHFADGQANPTGEQPPKPLNRWGRSFPDLVGLAGSVQSIYETDIDSIVTMEPYTFVDRSEYFTHADTLILQNYADDWANIGAALCDFDYLTPFSEDAEQTELTPREVP